MQLPALRQRRCVRAAAHKLADETVLQRISIGLRLGAAAGGLTEQRASARHQRKQRAAVRAGCGCRIVQMLHCGVHNCQSPFCIYRCSLCRAPSLLIQQSGDG